MVYNWFRAGRALGLTTFLTFLPGFPGAALAQEWGVDSVMDALRSLTYAEAKFKEIRHSNFLIKPLDLNGTFMFGQDRFGSDQDYFATYRLLRGTGLDAGVVTTIPGEVVVHGLGERPEEPAGMGHLESHVRPVRDGIRKQSGHRPLLDPAAFEPPDLHRHRQGGRKLGDAAVLGGHGGSS